MLVKLAVVVLVEVVRSMTSWLVGRWLRGEHSDEA
jgi:hypothetical protein